MKTLDSIELSPKHTFSKKHAKVNAITYRANSESDYTEKIRELELEFQYDNHCNYFWTDRDQSLLYGSPIFDAASDQPRKALNHLYWVIQNNSSAASEANTIVYNQVTNGVFERVGGYTTLCKELELETDQEYAHIHAFQKVGHRTKRSLIGNKGFSKLLQNKHNNTQSKAFKLPGMNAWSAPLQDKGLSLFAKSMLPKEQFCTSNYLQTLEAQRKKISLPTQGSAGRMASPRVLKFFTLNCGSSPFLACSFYAARYIANALLRSQEYPRSKYYKHLQKQRLPIPTPTAISHYHFMDESFHTTTSRVIAQEMYKDFPSPSLYETYVANWTVYLAQKNVIRYHGGLSCGLPARCFRDDVSFMHFIYQLLQSPIFEMSGSEALAWMRKSFCFEHEGFYVAQEYYQKFSTDLKNFFSRLSYLWPVNRELRLIDDWCDIEYGIGASTKAFKEFEIWLIQQS